MPRLAELPKYKECRTCGKTKNYREFTVRKITLKSGRTSFYLENECTRCASDRVSEHYHSKKKRPKETRAQLHLKKEPILAWLENNEVPHFVDYNIRKRLNDLQQGKAQHIHIDIVDRLFIQMDEPTLLDQLYPLT